ncbi:hypothetical protein H0H92_010226 [Tricholoma furcatifolium]|nr:hypothetical protein H0H92_010226 [Tricholoma furcatifolium]
MSKSDDTVPAAYPYSWKADSDIVLQDFLTKYKPSMVQNDGKKPWIWVHGPSSAQEDTGVSDAIEEASLLLKEVTEKVEAIKNDESIPVRSNKKTGTKSKKEVREQVQAEATDKLKEISIKHGYVSGKWLIFASAEKVDMIWTNLAKSLVSGPLASTKAHLAKVATSPESQDSSNYQHLICVYIPNVYDKDAVTEASTQCTKLTVRQVWKNAAIMSDKEAKELKDAFFAESSKATTTEQPSAATKSGESPPPAPESNEAAAPNKKKLKLKKKVDNDPFASDNDDEDEADVKKQPVKAKKPLPKKKTVEDDAPEEDGAKEKPKNQAGNSKSASRSIGKKRQASEAESDEDSESEDRPKKKPAKTRR